MKFLIIFLVLIVVISAVPHREECPNCKVEATENICTCHELKMKKVPLVNGTNLFCCGEKILLQGFWKKTWDSIRNSFKNGQTEVYVNGQF